MKIKQLLGKRAAQEVQDGMIVGLGTGSTAYWAIEELGARQAAGLNFTAVATSVASEEQARGLKIKMLPMAELKKVDITIDGADEVSHGLDLIKGGGGALLREKLVASVSDRLVIIADESKWVEGLGRFPLPVEVTQFGWEVTASRLSELGCKVCRRLINDSPFVTDNGNYIMDCQFDKIEDPQRLNTVLNLIPGVVENGLFVGMADLVFIGRGDGQIERMARL